MSPILVADKENDILINIKNRIENLIVQKNNKLKNFYLNAKSGKNISNFCLKNEKCFDISTNGQLIDYIKNNNKIENLEFNNNKKKDNKNFLDDTSLMPMYTFDHDIKLGYDGTIITDGKSDTLNISSLPEFKKENNSINSGNSSIYFSDSEILDKINNFISIENKKNEKEILNNIENNNFTELDNKTDFLNEYELSPILCDILSFGNLDYSEQTPWKISRIFDKSIRNFSTSAALDYSFKYLNKTKSLNPNFLNDIKDFDLMIDGIKLKSDVNKSILDKFKELIPEFDLQQLISTYVNRAILAQPYLNLIRENPELTKFRPINSFLTCNIERIDKSSFKIVITDITNLDIGNESSSKIYNSCGARTVMVISKDFKPKLQHLFYIK